MFGLAHLHLFGRDVYDTLVSVVVELSRNARDHEGYAGIFQVPG